MEAAQRGWYVDVIRALNAAVHCGHRNRCHHTIESIRPNDVAEPISEIVLLAILRDQQRVRFPFGDRKWPIRFACVAKPVTPGLGRSVPGQHAPFAPGNPATWGLRRPPPAGVFSVSRRGGSVG